MPFKSDKQRRYMYANHPEIAKRWSKKYYDGGVVTGPLNLQDGGVVGSLEDQLKQHEGFREEIYLDTQGNPTVGWGHKLPRGYLTEVGETPFSMEQLKEFFKSDIKRAEESAKANFSNWSSIPSSLQLALTNQAFQLGGKGQSKFKRMITAVERGDWARAAIEALRSKWASQTPVRAQALADAFRSQLGEKVMNMENGGIVGWVKEQPGYKKLAGVAEDPLGTLQSQPGYQKLADAAWAGLDFVPIVGDIKGA